MLNLTGITKQFPGVRALDGVDLSVGPGEIVGLVGENGAGKSTLIKILGGIHAYGSFGGAIRIDGAWCRFGSAHDARAAGVSVVHQELSLVPEMTVAENLCLGEEPTRFGMVDSVELIARSRRMLARFLGDDTVIDPEAPVGRLGVGMQQIVEIARALGSDARIVVLDEPTAALTDRESERLFALIRGSLEQGTSFIYISHRLEEVFELCDRVAVLRDGRNVGTRNSADTDADEIVAMMTGKELGELEVERVASVGDTVLRVEHLSVDHATISGRTLLQDVSLQVRAGEVVALAGAMGSGRTATLSALFGTMRGKVSGRISIDGHPVALRTPGEAIASGVALVPEDRKGAGLVLGMTVGENLTLAALSRVSTAGVIDSVADQRLAGDTAAELGVKTPTMATEVSTLSGGNQQKVAIGKWLLTEPRLLLLDEPTRGVDVGAKAEIYRLVRELADKGVAVLMASSDLPEVLLLADRVLVLREGRLAGELTREEATQEAILQLAVGSLH